MQLFFSFTIAFMFSEAKYCAQVFEQKAVTAQK